MSNRNSDFDEIRQNLLESSRRMKELHISQAKTDEQLKKTDEQIKELHISQAKTDEQLKKTDEQMKETAEQIKETDRVMKSIGQQLGGLGNHLGDSSEEFFFRSFEKKPVLGDIVFDSVERWIKKTKKSREIDILLINGSCVALIEVKFKADYKKLEEIKAQKICGFRENHFQYRNHKLYFGIASMSTEPELIEAAREAKMFLLTQQGDHLVVANDQAQPV